MATPISRRALLRASGTVSLAALLAACGETPDPDTAVDDPDTITDDGLESGDDVAAAAIAAVGLDVAPTLTPIVATFEVLTGPDGRIPFGVLDEDLSPMLDRDVQMWLVRGDEVVAGPIEPLFYGEGLGDRGIYIADVQLETTELHELVVQVDGGPVGHAAVPVRAPEESTAYAPGAAFPVISTPTPADPGPLETLCTQDPPCSMHETSLDAVIGTGPVVFTVATPQFCQTAVCGPVVEVIDGLRAELGRDDVTFIHAEVYTDAGNTVAPVVEELGLPTEPWTWVLDADGTVVDRFDGPVVPSLLSDAISRV